MSGYTKGPWHTSKRKPRQVCDERGYKVADCPTTTKGGNFNIALDVSIANATLIAATPDLLGALEAMLSSEINYMELNNLGSPDLQHNVKLARLAIAKAKG